MVYLKAVTDIMLLETELTKAKALYKKALKQTKEQSVLNSLRNTIKLLSRKINASHQQIPAS